MSYSKWIQEEVGEQSLKKMGINGSGSDQAILLIFIEYHLQNAFLEALNWHFHRKKGRCKNKGDSPPPTGDLLLRRPFLKARIPL
jgi:hypothetical protein